MHADCRQYTWSHLRESRISSARLDRIYCFKHHFNIFKMCSIVPAGFTDHSLLLCNVFIQNILPKSAYWHFNSVLTFDKHFKEVLIYFWDVFRQRKGEFNSLRQWWDHGKTEIKLLCQQHTLNVTRDITRSMKDLETDIVELERLSESTANRGYIEILKVKKLALADLLDVKVQGALVRSRFQAITEMDASSSFFFGLEKRSGQRRVIHSLLADTGQTLTEPSQIRRAVSFYSALYSSEYEEEEALMEEFCNGLPQVSEETNTQLNGPVQMQELKAALQGMQGRRAPGIDGLSVEFYKAFWDIFAKDLLDVFNESLASGSMPMSCRRAVITLLPKKGNLQDIKNWRPVSLLCVDYKLLSKLFASRLGKAMEQVIHRDQTYCVPGRSMVDNVHLIRDVLDVSSSSGCNTGLISLDQEKAFDRVEHNFLWKVMEKFGFSAGFIAKIKVLYSGVESVLKFNGGLCAPFRVCRGVRQGCALSGMLYTLSLEPLLNNIRYHLQGLVLPGFNSNIVLSAYADDIVVFIKDQRDADILTNIIKRFSVTSAARVNWIKSEALAVGEWRDGLPVLPQSLAWRTDGFRYLGVFLGKEHIVQKNWETVTEKIEGKLSKWKWLLPQMSFKGRVLVLNNLVASQLWHRLTCVDPPSGLLAQLQKKMVDFFWDGLHWVPQGVLFLTREEGGQGLVHLASRTATFRLQFLQKYLTGPADLVWRDVASCILRRADFLGLDAALFLIDSKLLKLSGLPPFYQGVFKSWALFNCKRCPKSDSLYWLLREPLIHRAKLDISSSVTPGLTVALLKTKTLCLQQLVDAVGPALRDARALGSLLGLHSVRVAGRLLELWRQKLSGKERSLLMDYGKRKARPDPADPFPDVFLSPGLGELTGPLLAIAHPEKLTINKADKKTWYMNCVKAIHKAGLCNRPPTVWSNRLGANGAGPQWRILYKPPLKKRTADLQWRILHGAIASNAFLSVLNPAVLNTCPFCCLPETECFYRV
uniref:Reverse transcriptase domain-containing protein n=1 Tax=Labrus bergylta TaxID=56723 RepID=A0A3Q3EUV6_9LABR